MNIIYIHTHDTGRSISPYGYALPTPNLQTFAEEGTVFRQCFDCGPTCSPARAGLLTGMAPHSCGMLGLAHRGFQLNDYSRHLARYLARNGYETALCGIQHVAPHKLMDQLGYTRMLQPDPVDQETARERLAAQGMTPHQINGSMHIVNDRAKIPAVTRFLREKHDKPFFLSFGMVCTHRDFAKADEDLDPNYMRPPAPLPDTPQTRNDMAEYATMVRCVDDCVGEVLQTLEETGLDEDTFVFFTTDHGIAFPAMKCNLYDEGIGVSLLVRYPGNQMAGEAIDALVSHVDLYPTLCEIAGVEKPDWLQGKSLIPLLKGESEEINEQIFSEVTYHAAYEPMRCVRTSRYKYIKYYDDFDKTVKPNIDNGYSKQFLMEHGLMGRAHDPKEMLFDLYYDPNERVNLVNDPAHADIRNDLAARLENWMKETNDPLLNGYVPKPEGAVVNIKNGIHASDKEYE